MTDKLLIKNAFFSFVKAFLVLVSPLITFPYASRILLPEGIGKVNFANSVISYFLIFSSLGIKNYASREVAKLKDNKLELSKFVKEILLINSISTIVVYIIMILGIKAIPQLYNERYLLLLCSLTLIFTVFSVDWLYIGLEKFRFTTICSFFIQISCITLMFCFVNTKKDFFLYTFFLTICPCIITGFINFIYSFRFIDYQYKIKLNIKKHLVHLFTFFGMSFVASFYNILDSLMIGFLSSKTQLGFYSAATKVNHMVLGLITSISLILLPRLTDYFQKNKKEFIDLSNKSISLVLFLAIPISIGIYCLSNPIIILLSGEAFLDSVIPMRIMTPIIIFIALSNIIGTQIFPAMNKEKITLVTFTFGAIVNIALNLLLIPTKGAIGAAIGTLFAELTVCIIQLLYLLYTEKIKIQFLQIFQFIFASLIMGIGVLSISNCISNVFLQILLSVFGGFFIYIIILIILRNKTIIQIQNILLSKIKES